MTKSEEGLGAAIEALKQKLFASDKAMKLLAGEVVTSASQVKLLFEQLENVPLASHKVNKIIHVDAYTKTVDGKVIQVDPYTMTKKVLGATTATAKKGVFTSKSPKNIDAPDYHQKSAGVLDAEYELHPGDKLFETDAGNLLLQKKDGTHSLIYPTPKGEPPNLGGSPMAKIAEQAKSGKLPLVDENPEIDEKIDTGLVYVDVDSGAGEKQVALGPGDAAYKIGSSYTLISVGGTPAAVYSPEGKKTITIDSGPLLKAYADWVDTHPENLIAKGSGSAGPQPDPKSSVIPDVIKDGFFVHPVTNAKVAVQPGDVLYHHKTSKLSWLIMHPEGANHQDGQGTFIGKNGKPMKASPIALKAVKTGNYDDEYTVPGKVDPSLVGKDVPEVNQTDPSTVEAPESPAPEAPKSEQQEPVPAGTAMTVDVGGGKKADLPVGWKAAKSATGFFTILYDGGNNPVQTYNSDGELIPPESTNIDAWKSYLKNNPGALLAENAVKKPEPKKTKKAAAPKPEAVEPWGEIKSSADAEAAYGASYDRLYAVNSIEDLVAKRDDIARDIATFNLFKSVAELDKGKKAQFTKYKNKLALLLRVADFKKQMDAGESSPEVDAEFTALNEKLSYPSLNKTFSGYFPVHVGTFWATLEKAYSQEKFKQTLIGIGFDIYAGTEAQYQQLAVKEGFEWAGGLDQQTGKLWAQAHFKDPTVSSSTLTHIAKIAKSNVVLANAKVAAAKALENAKAPEPKPVEDTAAKKAAMAAVQKKEAQLHELAMGYEGPLVGGNPGETFSLTHQGPGTWTLEYPNAPHATQTITDAEALAIVQQGKGLKVTNSSLAYPLAVPTTDYESVAKASQAKLLGLIKQVNPSAETLYDLKPGELNSLIKGLGGNYVGKMDAATKQLWLKWYVAGHPTATYALEDQAVQKSSNTSVHVIAGTNPGSWDSPQGKEAWQLLSDRISSLQGGSFLLSTLTLDQDGGLWGLSEMEADSLVKELNLKPLIAATSIKIESIPLAQKRKAIKDFWELHHDHLPPASGKPLPAASLASLPDEPQADWEIELLNGPSKGNAPAEPAPPAVPPAPSGVSKEDWTLVVALAQGNSDPSFKKAVSDLLEGTDNAELSLDALGSNPSKIVTANADLKKLLIWSDSKSPYLGGKVPDSNALLSAKKQSIKTAVVVAINSDIGISSESKIWKDDYGHNWSVPPGWSIFKYQNQGLNNKNLLLNTDGTEGYWVGNNGNFSVAPNYLIANVVQSAENQYAEYSKVFTAANPLTAAQAKSEIGTSQFDWDTVEQAEQTDFNKLNLGYPVDQYNEADIALLVKKQAPSIISAHVGNLPGGVQKLAYFALFNGDQSVLDLIQWKLKKGHYDVAEPEDAPVFAPGSWGAKFASAGYNDYEQLYYNYGGPELKLAYTELKGAPWQGYSSSKALLASEVWKLFQAKLAEAPKAKPAPSADLVLKKTSKSLSGMHSKIVWADQHGNEWMSKGFPNDPNGSARVDAEHYSNVIARLHGFRAPETRVMTLEGKYSYVQLLKPAQGDLTSKSLDDLTDAQLIDAMAEHILDWLVSNHDSNPQNIMIDTDGKIFGIDKGQAFRFFPDDKLAVGYLPPSNPVSVFYDKFYKAIQSGTFDKERADKVALAIMERAKQIQSRNDKRHRELLESALKQRKSWPEEFPTREKFINGLMQRKSTTLADFENLYKSIYNQAGWSWDIDTSQLGKAKLDDHTHVAISEDLAADVKTSGSHGKALFFNSQDLEDAHILLYLEQDTKGKPVLKGDTKLRKDADVLVTAWLKDQLIVDDSGYKAGFVGDDEEDYDDDSEDDNSYSATQIPGNSTMYSALVNYTKTVNTHAEDSQYNEGTVSAAAKIKSQIKQHLEAIEAFEDFSPEKVYGKSIFNQELITAEQQDAWKKAAQYYFDAFDKVDQAKSNGVKVKALFPDAVPFVAQQYNPSPDLDTSGEPKVVGKWQNSTGDVLEQWSDGGWVQTLTDGTKLKLTTEDGKTISKGWDPASLDAPATSDSTEDKPAEEKKGESAPQWILSNGFSYTQLPDGSWKVFKDEKATGKTLTPDEMSTTAEADPEAEFIVGTGGEDEATVTSSTGKVLKVVKRQSTGTVGKYDPVTGVLKHKAGELKGGYTGYEYDVENEDGSVVVEYRPWSEPGVAKSQQGLLRFSVKNWTGSKDQIEDVLDTMQTMGVDLTPADEQSMELFYWRHLYGILQDRKDSTSSKWSKTTQHIMDAWKANPDMDSSAELEMLREAWAKSFGTKVVDDADFLPKFSRNHLKMGSEGFTAGKPYWNRPDFSMEDLKKVYGDTAPVHAISGFESRIHDILRSGGLWATEERTRLLGSWIEGMSSSADQGHGSSGFLFTRQNQMFNGSQIYLHPKVALRTTNYAFNNDHFGEVDSRKTSASFDLKTSAGQSGGSNELMIKNGVSVLDDIAVIVFPNKESRAKALQIVHDAGITKLHGILVEDLFVVGNVYGSGNDEIKAAMSKVWGSALSVEKGA